MPPHGSACASRGAFGVGEGAGAWWADRWDRGRAATERVYIRYAAINQLSSGVTNVEIEGSGVKLVIKAVGRRDQLVTALDQRRHTPASAASATGLAREDPVALLRKLGELRDGGVLTEEEFADKKTELLERM